MTGKKWWSSLSFHSYCITYKCTLICDLAKMRGSFSKLFLAIARKQMVVFLFVREEQKKDFFREMEREKERIGYEFSRNKDKEEGMTQSLFVRPVGAPMHMLRVLHNCLTFFFLCSLHKLLIFCNPSFAFFFFFPFKKLFLSYYSHSPNPTSSAMFLLCPWRLISWPASRTSLLSALPCPFSLLFLFYLFIC